jgi:transposase
MRSAYRCRAYPDEAQQVMLTRTFGCVRVVWNLTLAARGARWRTERKGTSYAQTDRALTILKKDPDLAFLNEVSAVPLQQARRYGRTVAVVDRWYPSSKTCSTCGFLLDSLSLGMRHWTCPSCGAQHDRDINAAKNILAAGLAVTACGGDIRRMGIPSARPPMKQESQPARGGIPSL